MTHRVLFDLCVLWVFPLLVLVCEVDRQTLRVQTVWLTAESHITLSVEHQEWSGPHNQHVHSNIKLAPIQQEWVGNVSACMGSSGQARAADTHSMHLCTILGVGLLVGLQ